MDPQAEEAAHSVPPTAGTAQNFLSKVRTRDVHIEDKVTFADMGLSPNVRKGLFQAGFERPSPIQLSAIPYGRCGLDLVVQAKSGTGKTCVFTIILLEAVDTAIQSPQALVLAPTREIALQIEQVITSVGCCVPGLRCYCAIGGLSLKQDMEKVKKAHVVVGTPGRVKQLMELSSLDCSSVRMMVLDEADKLLESSFQEQINWIYTGLPESKQMVVASATYTEGLVKHLCNYMHNPTFVRLNSNDPVLLGVRQYKQQVASGHLPNSDYNSKVEALISILSKINFQQCLVFSNLMTRAENLSKLMISRGWPTAHIAGCQDQNERIAAITRLKAYDCRVLISTDLTARGIDADRIDLVINLDLPYDCETYLHRVGRAGRFGAKGAAITLYSAEEAAKLEAIANEIKTRILPLPDSLESNLIAQPVDLESAAPVVAKIETFEILTSPRSAAETRSFCGESNRPTKPASPMHQVQSGDNRPDASGLLLDTQHPTQASNLDHQLNNDRRTVLATIGGSSVEVADRHGAGISHDQICNGRAGETGHLDADLYEIVKHRPPFRSLKEALQFLDDPVKHAGLLNTTQYVDRLKSSRGPVAVRTEEVAGAKFKAEDEIVPRQSPKSACSSATNTKACVSRGRAVQTEPVSTSSSVPARDDVLANDVDGSLVASFRPPPPMKHSATQTDTQYTCQLQPAARCCGGHSCTGSAERTRASCQRCYAADGCRSGTRSSSECLGSARHQRRSSLQSHQEMLRKTLDFHRQQTYFLCSYIKSMSCKD